MVSTPIHQATKLSPLQQRLIRGLERLPEDISLCLLNGKKIPQGKDWQKRPYSKAEVSHAIAHGIELENSSGKKYRFFPQGYGLMAGYPITVNGEKRYLLVIDQDGPSAKRKLEEISGGNITPTVKTTSGRNERCHRIYYVTEEYVAKLQTKKIATGELGEDGKPEHIEFLWLGRQAVLPPSVHPMTGCYQYLDCSAFDPNLIAHIQDWGIEKMLREAPSATTSSAKLQREEWSNEEWALSYLYALNLNRADDYDNWVTVGMALHSVSDSLLSKWDDWSRQSSKYKPGDCEKKWKSFNRQGIAIGSLAHMAKQDGWRSPFKTSGRGYGGGMGGGGGRGNGGSSGSGGDGGDGDGGDNPNGIPSERNSKVVKHPSFNPISPEDLEARLNGLIQEGLTGSRLTGKLNQLAELTGRHILELRKQYLELLAEVEQSELRDDTAEQVELLLEASTASLDLNEILPSTLATPLLKLAGWLNLKPECYLTTLLTTVSVLHKASTTVVLNKEQDFEVSPNLYSAIIAPSSQKKSPILKAICKKPLSLLQKQAHEEYKLQMKAYEEELREWEKSNPEERGNAPEKPERKIYFFTKTTGEGLTYQAARCPEQGMLYLSDELAGMLGAQNQYRGGKGSDKQDLLSYYDGSGEVTLRADGVKSESDFVLLGIMGGIQPKVFQKLLDDCSDPDGGWARFLFVNQPIAASQMSADGGSYDLTNLLSGLYQQIDALPPTTYRLSPEAFRLFCKAYDRLEKKRVSDRFEGMQAVWGKAEGRMGKLAVNLHVIHALMNGQAPSEEIPVEFIQAAIVLTKYYAQQVQSLYTQFSDPDALAPHLANVVQLAQRKGDWIKASDVYLSITKKHRPSGEKVREWFSELVLMGKGEVKGEGRNLQFRIFSDKSPPPPPSDSPLTSDPPSGVLDDFRQELDKSSNAESTTYQGSQEKLDKLDNLDDFPKSQKKPVEVEEEELEIHQDGFFSPAEKKLFLGESSNLSNNSHGDQWVGNTALDDWSKQSSNLDKEPKIDLASNCHLTAQLIEESQQPLVNDPTEVVLDEPTSENVDDCGQCGQVWSECPHPQTEKESEVEASVVNCGQGQDTQEQEIDEVSSASVEPESVQEIVVGSVVYWDNCPGHWDSWAPFVVEYIQEDGMVKLEIVHEDYLIHISQLRLAI